MGELGQLLRETREEKKITLEEVESATRIRLKYLVALEEGNYDVLPTPGHAYGFLRNYAMYIGLDVDEVESLYASDGAKRRLFEPGIFHPKDISLSPRRSMFQADVILVSVIVLVLLVIGGWVFWQYGWPLIRPAPTPTATPTVTPTATPKQAVVRPSPTATYTPLPPTETAVPSVPTSTEPAPAPTSTATDVPPTPTATSTPRPTRTSTPAPTRVQNVVLKIKVVERAWLQVTLDGKSLPGELLEADEEREWQAQESIYFICGNAGGVEAAVNGEQLGVLGERAQVVEKIWTPAGEVTPTPTVKVSTTPAVTPAAGGQGNLTPTPTQVTMRAQ